VGVHGVGCTWVICCCHCWRFCPQQLIKIFLDDELRNLDFWAVIIVTNIKNGLIIQLFTPLFTPKKISNPLKSLLVAGLITCSAESEGVTPCYKKC